MSSPLSQADEHNRMWDGIDVALADDRDYPHVMTYIAALRDLYGNGEVCFASFCMPAHPAFDAYAAQPDLYAMEFLQRFWLTPTVKEHVFGDFSTAVDGVSADVFTPCDPGGLGDIWAGALIVGGAYRSHEAGEADAKQKSMAATNELLAEGDGQTRIYLSRSAWCTFFCDVAWDLTCVIIHPTPRRIHVMCATDTD